MNGVAPGPMKSVAMVAQLAFADLRHEWILTLCLVLAIAAVVSPLLILMGLKHGTIETLRCSLVQDPVYREVRPVETRRYDAQWFDRMRRDPGVGFLIPTILPASSIIAAMRPGIREPEYLDLIPTGSGDPLVLENGGRIPGADEVVLTDAAAKQLGVGQGDTLELRATRSRAGISEYGPAMMRVKSVLSPRAGTLPRVYAPLDLVLDVETYKEGMAVPDREWSGGTAHPYLSYDGIMVVVPRPLRPVEEYGLAVNTGLTKVERMGHDEFHGRTGLALRDSMHAYDLFLGDGSIQAASYRAVKDKLRGHGAILLPYADSMTLELTLRSGREVRVPVAGVSLAQTEREALGAPGIPWGGLDLDVHDDERARQLLLPETIEGAVGDLLAAHVESADGPLEFPLRVAGHIQGSTAWIPAELLGVLRTGRDRPIVYDKARASFLLARTGFQGFRLYADDIDAVVPVVSALRRQGIEVIAQVNAIERIRILDRGLTNVFWLVAVVGISGGVAALIASLYAAVQRKRRELSVMRLIGLSRFDVFRFPVFQGLGMATLSLLCAFLGYFSLASVINRVFATDLAIASQACQSEQRICGLPAEYLAVATGATLLVAFSSSLIAAWKATQIDPAEALREE